MKRNLKAAEVVMEADWVTKNDRPAAAILSNCRPPVPFTLENFSSALTHAGGAVRVVVREDVEVSVEVVDVVRTTRAQH